jgi:flagellar biosynthesis/type III secretory pathway chaperone
MNSPASQTTQRTADLQRALIDVHGTLTELLTAADEQYAALAARDRDRLETITGQQERLSARLARAETRRLQLLGGRSLKQVLEGVPAAEATRVARMANAIGRMVRELQRRHERAGRLLNRTIELNAQTMTFIQRLVTVQNPVYGRRPLSAAGAAPGNAGRQSLLVDSRA